MQNSTVDINYDGVAYAEDAGLGRELAGHDEDTSDTLGAYSGSRGASSYEDDDEIMDDLDRQEESGDDTEDQNDDQGDEDMEDQEASSENNQSDADVDALLNDTEAMLDQLAALVEVMPEDSPGLGHDVGDLGGEEPSYSDSSSNDSGDDAPVGISVSGLAPSASHSAVWVPRIWPKHTESNIVEGTNVCSVARLRSTQSSLASQVQPTGSSDLSSSSSSSETSADSSTNPDFAKQDDTVDTADTSEASDEEQDDDIPVPTARAVQAEVHPYDSEARQRMELIWLAEDAEWEVSLALMDLTSNERHGRGDDVLDVKFSVWNLYSPWHLHTEPLDAQYQPLRTLEICGIGPHLPCHHNTAEVEGMLQLDEFYGPHSLGLVQFEMPTRPSSTWIFVPVVDMDGEVCGRVALLFVGPHYVKVKIPWELLGHPPSPDGVQTYAEFFGVTPELDEELERTERWRDIQEEDL